MVFWKVLIAQMVREIIMERFHAIIGSNPIRYLFFFEAQWLYKIFSLFGMKINKEPWWFRW